MVLRALLLSLCCGCIPKNTNPIRIGDNNSVTSSTMHVSSQDSSFSPLPLSVVDRLNETLKSHTIVVKSVDNTDEYNALSTTQFPVQRAQLLAEHHPTSDLVLIIQTRAEYFAQMTGRYRWVVTAHLVLADPQNLSRIIEDTVEIPVFMQFHHERDDAVLDAAIPALEQVVVKMFQSWQSAP